MAEEALYTVHPRIVLLIMANGDNTIRIPYSKGSIQRAPIAVARSTRRGRVKSYEFVGFVGFELSVFGDRRYGAEFLRAEHPTALSDLTRFSTR